jgi:dUTP pyrophosphatase
VHPQANIPFAATRGAAAVDLCTDHDETIAPGEWKLIKTGLKMAIPDGHVGLICSRSGLSLKKGLIVLNAPGVIDSDYRGEIGVILANFGKEDQVVQAGERVAQIMFQPFVLPEFVEVDELPSTERGEGGFGSTGIAVKTPDGDREGFIEPAAIPGLIVPIPMRQAPEGVVTLAEGTPE